MAGLYGHYFQIDSYIRSIYTTKLGVDGLEADKKTKRQKVSGRSFSNEGIKHRVIQLNSA